MAKHGSRAIPSSKLYHNFLDVSLLCMRHEADGAPVGKARKKAVNGYDSSTFNSVQGYETFVTHFKDADKEKIDPNVIGAVNTAYTCGGIVSGFLITPTLSKLFGRRFCMQLGCMLVNVSTFIQVFAPNMGAFIAGRCVMGIGQGLAVPTGPTYISEIAPARVRGVMMSFWQLAYTIGAAVVYWVAYGTNMAGAHLGNWRWRIPILMQLVFPTIVFCGMFWAPESPRWLSEKGRQDKALHCLQSVRDADDAKEELLAIQAAIDYEKSVVTSQPKWWTPYVTLFREKSLRRRMLVALFINAGQQVCGNGMLASYSTLIYQRTFSNRDTIFLINSVYGTLSILFTLSCTFLVERMGRRNILLIGAVGQGLSLLVISIMGVTTPEYEDGTRPYGVGIGVAALFFTFAIFYKPSWGATVWVYTSEIFSTDVRAHAVAMASQTQAVVSTILNQFFPIFLANCGFYTFFFFAGLNIFLFAGVWFFLPETKGIPLEDVDTLFGGTSRRVGGEALHDQELKSGHHDQDVAGSKQALGEIDMDSKHDELQVDNVALRGESRR